jgi:cyclophilin family peptidyl-prolyl cis-trans isomerase
MTVLNFVTLAKRKTFFPGTVFHRVVPNFVVQGGDPRGDGWGGPGYSLRSEFFPATYSTGSVGMASSGKDTEGSQFFITHSPQPHLDGRYTVFGRVIRGMAVADAIQIDDTVVDVDLLP